MGIDPNKSMAYLKSQLAAGSILPSSGAVFMTVRDEDKEKIVPIARMLVEFGFTIYATAGTSTVLRNNGLSSQAVFRISRGRPNILDMIEEKSISWIINTPSTGPAPKIDEIRMRTRALMRGIPVTTTLAGAEATINGLSTLKRLKHMEVCSLQEYGRHALKLNLSKLAPRNK